MSLDTGHYHMFYQILDGKKRVLNAIEDAALTVSGVGGPRELTYPVGSGSLNIGDCVYLTSTQKWELSKNDTGSTMPSRGVVTTTASGEATVLLEGLTTLTDYAGSFSTGDIIYVDIDGRLTTSYVTTAGRYLQRMGFVHDGPGGGFEIDPDDTMVLL